MAHPDSTRRVENLTLEPKLKPNRPPAAATPVAGESLGGGVYVHIPFCRQKCGYCDFYSITDPRLHRPFVNSLKQELRLFSNPPFI